jgi:hypothetical protein
VALLTPPRERVAMAEGLLRLLLLLLRNQFYYWWHNLYSTKPATT